jgi:hypothetical protein
VPEGARKGQLVPSIYGEERAYNCMMDNKKALKMSALCRFSFSCLGDPIRIQVPDLLAMINNNL